MPDKHDDSPECGPEGSQRDEEETFARRAEWWRQHYGGDATEADRKIRDMAQLPERPSPDDP